MRLTLAKVLALGASGAYEVTAALDGNSAAVILCVAEWLADTDNWIGAGYALTANEVDDIDAMVGELVHLVQTGVPGNGGNGLVSFVVLRDKKAQDTPGGTFTSGARRTRVLNDELDPDNICNLTDNEFFLDAGDYFVLWVAPAHRVGFNQSWLYNVTGDVDLVIGSSEMANIDAGATTIHSIGIGLITVAAAQTLRIEHHSSHTFATRGFGAEANLDNEVYTQLLIMRIE